MASLRFARQLDNESTRQRVRRAEPTLTCSLKEVNIKQKKKTFVCIAEKL